MEPKEGPWRLPTFKVQREDNESVEETEEMIRGGWEESRNQWLESFKKDGERNMGNAAVRSRLKSS